MPYGACRLINYPCIANPNYDEGAYIPDLYCLGCINPFGADTWDFSTKTSTNIGGGLLAAGGMFAVDTREDSLWVVPAVQDTI